MTADSRVRQLRAVPLFELCSADELGEISLVCSEEIHPRGTVLFDEGAKGDVCYFVLEGRIVVRAGGRAVGVVNPGETLGEMALVEAAPRFASATVVDEVRCLAVRTEDFSALLDRMPSLCRGLLVALSRRLRSVQEPSSAWG